MNQQVTGKPSIDKPWMKYYPSQLIQGLTIPEQTVYEYLMERCPGDDVAAIHYYGRDIRWRELKEQVDLAARVKGRKVVLGTAQDLDTAEEVWQGAVDLVEELDDDDLPVRPELYGELTRPRPTSIPRRPQEQ